MGRLDRRVQELLAEEDGYYGTGLATAFSINIKARELLPRFTKGKRHVYVVSMWYQCGEGFRLGSACEPHHGRITG